MKILCITLCVIFFYFISETFTAIGESEFAFLYFILIVFVPVIILYILFFRTVATWLYSKFTLKMNISLQEAKQLNPAITPLIGATYLPLLEIKDVAENLKFETALQFQEAWIQDKKQKNIANKLEFKNANNTVKLIRYSMYGACIVCALIGFMNWPPANYISGVFTSIFDDEVHYYPMLNIVVMLVPVLVVGAYLENKFK